MKLECHIATLPRHAHMGGNLTRCSLHFSHFRSDFAENLLESLVGYVAEIFLETLQRETFAEAFERRKVLRECRFARQAADVDEILRGEASQFDSRELGGERGKTDSRGPGQGVL